MGHFDVLSDIDLFCLKYVFPKINEALKEFTSLWNNHAIAKERGRSPRQLWLTRMITSDADLQTVGADYGQDEDADIDLSEDEDTERVVVPEIEVELSRQTADELRRRFDPLAEDGAYGCIQYVEVRNFVLGYQ